MRKVRAIQNTKSTCCTDACHCTPNDGIFATGPSHPERSTISITSVNGDSKPLQALHLKRNLEAVKNIANTVAAVQMFLESHNGAPADRISFTDGRVAAALERTYLCTVLIKTKEELHCPATTDDEEDDEIGDLIDTFRYFTEKPSGETPWIKHPGENI